MKPKHHPWYVLEKDPPSDYDRSNIRTMLIDDRFAKMVRDTMGVGP